MPHTYMHEITDVEESPIVNLPIGKPWGGKDVFEDIRVLQYRPLIPPNLLHHEISHTERSRTTVINGRACTADIVRGTDKRQRLLVVIGPCSIHDPEAALDYATLLQEQIRKHRQNLVIVMRAYVEKPRTTVGWKGIVNDPGMDESFDINGGLRLSRQLLIDLNNKGIPLAGEILGGNTPQYLADCLSLGAIGARTTESQVHREIASSLPFPIGFKNGTDGSPNVAIDAILAAERPHQFISVSNLGTSSIVSTSGNPDCFTILRGGSAGPNYTASHVGEVKARLEAAGLAPRVMVDCSHGNSQKQFKNQLVVVESVARQVAVGERDIIGVMIESNINEGNQKLNSRDPSKLEYGVSITDACIGWEDTVAVLEQLSAAVQIRRDRTLM